MDNCWRGNVYAVVRSLKCAENLLKKDTTFTVNRDKLRNQALDAKSQIMDIKRTSQQTQVKVSSKCQIYDLQPITSNIDSGSETVCLTFFVDTDRSVAYIDHRNHLVYINKQSKDSGTQSSSSDSCKAELENKENIIEHTVMAANCISPVKLELNGGFLLIVMTLFVKTDLSSEFYSFHS